jgi:hypothetical protein
MVNVSAVDVVCPQLSTHSKDATVVHVRKIWANVDDYIIIDNLLIHRCALNTQATGDPPSLIAARKGPTRAPKTHPARHASA